MIEIKNLSFKYKGAKEMSLRDINLKISSGECILLMGESGCGKTSITRLINGLIPEFYDGELSGEIYLDNQDLSKLYISQIAKNVGSVFQDPRGQFFSTDTNSELAFGLECQGISSEKIKTRVDQIILDLKLEALANRSIFELSGGEKQQIAIGSVYATKPKVILLDEPSANLDDKGIIRLAKVLKLLKSKNYTIVIAEHRINYLLDLIDRAIFMNKGRIETIYFAKDLIKMSNEERKQKGFRNLKSEQLERKSTQEVFGETVLKVKDLKFYYDKSRPILNNLNLSLRSGEVIGIAGNNGEGKSTLLKIICGLIKEKSGEIYFNNERLKPKARVKNAYYVMQDSDYQLFTDSVRNEFSIGDIDASDAKILKTLEELSLKEYIERHPLSLSGGQKQRLCIAVAKLKASKLICLDEPTSGLDYRSMLKVNNLIEKLRLDKKAILIVSHDKEFLYKVCDKILYLENGQLKERSQEEKMNHNYPKSFKELISPIKKEIVITILLSALGAMSLLISPIAVTISVNKYLNGSVDSFLYWIIIAALGLVFKQILHMMSVGYAHIVEAKFRYQLRKDFSDKLSRLPLGFFSENTSGTIRKLISEDTINIHTIIAHMISDLTSGLLLPILCIIVMLIVEWHTAIMITLFTFLILVIGMIWTSISSRGIEEINERYEKAQRDMSHASIEMIDGIKEIKNFGLTDSLFKRFDDALMRFTQTSYEWLNSSSKPMAFIMAAIQPTIMLLVSISACIFSIKNSWLSPEYTILFLLMSITLPSSLINIMQLSNFIRIGRHSVNVLLDLYSKSDQKFIENPKKFAIGDIEFKNVSFEYEDEDEVLKNIDCKIESGKITALVGPSGSGKTTMIRLIARFWDINKGEITIGGINVKDFSEREILSNIALVFQDIALINASIYENIALSKPNATKEEIIAAAKSAYIHDRIMQLPHGYDSIYGDENIILSGGEKQRVTIARAFLADAPIVLLDEATAQADAESEFEIQKALSKLSQDKTVVIIAHRLTSVVNADQILVFDNGKIVERGNHNQLINKEGLYQKMWKAQDINRGEYNGTI